MTISERTDGSPATDAPVSSKNEWDRLEEVVVGRLDGAAANTPAIPRDETRKDLQAFAKQLTAEGVEVRRPEAAPYERTFETVDWKERGFSSACPRDGVLVVGDQIIETPLGWRARYYDTDALRPLFFSYFQAGARWISAPRPELKEELYEEPRGDWLDGTTPPVVVGENEPILAASDVARCDRDLFVMRTASTNRQGITWLRRHLGTAHAVHEIEPRKQFAGPLDTVFVPLGPGEVMVRDDAVDPEALPAACRDWNIRSAPQGGDAVATNLLVLGPKRAMVEASQTSMIEALRSWGFEVIPVPLAGYAALGGSLRRATLDIRRAT